jgi:Ca2+-binding RTX toxin-like protein
MKITRYAFFFLIGMIFLGIISAMAAANSLPQTNMDDRSQAIIPDDLAPPECAGMGLTNMVSGTGTINGTGQNDLILGTSGNETIRGRQGNDCIVAGGGDDNVRGNQGDDVILGGPGVDDLNGNRHNDVLYGGAGDDVLDGGQGTDVCTGGPGADTFNRCETQNP